MARLDVHSHYISAEVLSQIQKIGHLCDTPFEDRGAAGVFIHTPERAYGPIRSAFFDLDERRSYMDGHGIDRQLLVAPPFLFLYWSTTDHARRLMRMENEGIAAATRHSSDRFLGLGTVMLQDIEASIRECRAIKEMGLLGVEVGSNVLDRNLDDERLFGFYEALEDLGLVLFIHPHNVAGRNRMADFHLRNLVGFPLDTTLAAAQLIFSGVLDRYPKLRICLGQAGGFLPFIIGRLDAGFLARPECRANIDRKPSEYLRRFYYDSIIHSRTASSFLTDTVGADRVMFGTDFPFDMGSTSPVQEIEGHVHLTDGQRARIYEANAVEFLGLSC